VITVGASSTQGTTTRADDVVASFSSRGPTYKDWGAKPDLVAPGTGTVSLANPQSAFYTTKTSALSDGTLSTPFKPYLSLSGTSMAAPVVSGTVALMMQADPALTPNLVKAILEYTAQPYPGYDGLTQGAGFLNTLGAVRLARFFATAQPGDPYPVESLWSRSINWGNYRLTGGVLLPNVNAWQLGTTWGSARAVAGENIVWGTTCDGGCDNIVWGTGFADNIVWGTAFDNIVWGTMFAGDNIVWGTAFDNIVWGTDCGGADCDNIVWGTVDDDNIVWGTASREDNIVWGTAFGNIVWGTAAVDDVVWTTADDNIVWGTSAGVVPFEGLSTVNAAAVGAFDAMTDDQVFAAALAPPAGLEAPPDDGLIMDSTPLLVDSAALPSGNVVIVLDATAPTTSNPDPVASDPVSEPLAVLPSDPLLPPSDPAVLSAGGI
jgi:subtilisin family serine protease